MKAMFRFTIRDLLWLMVVVGMIVVLVLAERDRNDLRDRLKSAELSAQENETEGNVLKIEWEKLSGKRYRGMYYLSDPESKVREYKIHYDP